MIATLYQSLKKYDELDIGMQNSIKPHMSKGCLLPTQQDSTNNDYSNQKKFRANIQNLETIKFRIELANSSQAKHVFYSRNVEAHSLPPAKASSLRKASSLWTGNQIISKSQ